MPRTTDPSSRGVKAGVFRFLMVCIVLLVSFGAAEIALRLYGVTDPLIYRNADHFGFEPAPAQTIRRGNVPQSIDEEGFRCLPGTEESNCRRIVFIGDSVTHGGAYIRTEDTFVGLVGREMIGYGYAAKNGGVCSYSISQMANRYMHSLECDRDAIVVVHFIVGDWYRPHFKTLLSGGPFYLQKPRIAVWEAIRLLLRVKFRRYLGGGYVIPASVTRSKELRGAVGYVSMDHFLECNLEAAATLIEFCREKSRRVIFVHSPIVRRGLQPLEDGIADFLKGQGAEFYDLADSFVAKSTDDLFVDMSHYSEAGHRLAADLLLEILTPIVEEGDHGDLGV